MKRESFEQLGAVHKSYEASTEHQLVPGLPVVARLDGRSFSTFTLGLVRPYDAVFSQCMQDTAAYLMETMQAVLAYRQSDEITLVWPNQTPEQAIMFDGRVMKLATTLAATASVKFNQLLMTRLPRYAAKLPTFDARVFQYPSLELAAENLLWRETDAMRNSVTNLAHVQFGHSRMHGVSVREKLRLLDDSGHPWSAMPEVYQRGVYLRREKVLRLLSAEVLAKIPEAHRPTGPVARNEVMPFALPLLETLANPVQALFQGATPVTQSVESCVD